MTEPRATPEREQAAWAATWDEWIGFHATRNEVAENYAQGLRTHGISWPHWPHVNAAIQRRWSPSGLAYIKKRAWKIATGNL